MRQSQWAGEVETVLRRAVPPTDIARRSPSRPASFRLPRAFRSPLRLSVSPAKAGAQYACGCAATHAASARSAGPLRPNERRASPPPLPPALWIPACAGTTVKRHLRSRRSSSSSSLAELPPGGQPSQNCRAHNGEFLLERRERTEQPALQAKPRGTKGLMRAAN